MCPPLHRLSVTPRTAARQAPLSMGFSRQEYWRGFPFPPPGDHPHPGTELVSPASPALASRFFTTVLPEKASAKAQSYLSSSLSPFPGFCIYEHPHLSFYDFFTSFTFIGPSQLHYFFRLTDLVHGLPARIVPSSEILIYFALLLQADSRSQIQVSPLES